MEQSNQLVRSTLTEIMSIGKAFAESGMFPDIKTAAQAVVKIQAGAEMGIPPFAAMSGIHIIQGKPTVGAGLMAANVKGSGKYDYRVLESTEKVCTVEFFQRTIKDGKPHSESLGKSSFTIEDAKKAGTKNIDKFPKNMLFARAISNGVKWFTPDVFAGPVYVPEEMEAVKTEEGTAEVVAPPVKLSKADLKHAQGMLENSTTLEELGANWKAIGITAQAALAQVKDEMKVKLTPIILAEPGEGATIVSQA